MVRRKTLDIGLGNDFFFFFFFGMNPQSIGNKRKNRQKGLYQTKKFLHSKGNGPQSEMTAYRMKKYLQTIHVIVG